MLLVDVCASWLLYVELAVMIYLPSQRHSMIDSSVLIPEPVTVLLIISHFTKYRNTLYVDVWPVMYDVMCSVATGVTCAGGSGGAVMSCYNCGKPGHMSRDCTEMRMSSSGGGGSGSTCYNCGESGHFSRECPNRMSSDERMDTRKCYNCNETGHLSRDCPDANRRSSDRSAVECFRCPPCVFLRNYWSLVPSCRRHTLKKLVQLSQFLSRVKWSLSLLTLQPPPNDHTQMSFWIKSIETSHQFHHSYTSS